LTWASLSLSFFPDLLARLSPRNSWFFSPYIYSYREGSSERRFEQGTVMERVGTSDSASPSYTKVYRHISYPAGRTYLLKSTFRSSLRQFRGGCLLIDLQPLFSPRLSPPAWMSPTLYCRHQVRPFSFYNLQVTYGKLACDEELPVSLCGPCPVFCGLMPLRTSASSVSPLPVAIFS